MYRFADGLHARLVNKRIVLLDTRTSSYNCLTDEADEALQRLATNQLLPSDEAIFRRLQADGILTTGETSRLSLDGPEIPTVVRSAQPLQKSHQPPALVLEAVLRQMIAGALMRWHALPAPHATTASSTLSSKSLEVIKGGSAAFLQSERLLSSEQQCLRRSIAFRAYLDRRHIRPLLVLGVRMRPFSAHAWLQIADCVLNDQVDNIRAYAPILAI